MRPRPLVATTRTRVQTRPHSRMEAPTRRPVLLTTTSNTCLPPQTCSLVHPTPPQTSIGVPKSASVMMVTSLIRPRMVRRVSCPPLSPCSSPRPLAAKYGPSPARLAELTAGFPTPASNNGPPQLITTGRMTKTHADPLIAQRTYH